MQYILHKFESLSRKKSYLNSKQYNMIYNFRYCFWTIFKLSKRFSFWIRSLKIPNQDLMSIKLQKHTKQRNSKIYFFFVSSCIVSQHKTKHCCTFSFFNYFLVETKKNHNNSCCIFVSSIRSHVEQISIYFQLFFFCVFGCRVIAPLEFLKFSN